MAEKMQLIVALIARRCLQQTRWVCIGVALAIGAQSIATAGPLDREQAYRITNRLAGVPPSEATLISMEADIQAGNAADAAATAMNNASFYTVTLKNFAAPWTDRDQSVFVPLNDYIATVIGMIRDGEPFNTLFSANIL